MILVFLPGLDGTGRLFKYVIEHLSDVECQILSLPEEGEQNYDALTNTIETQLPKSEHIIIAESFSGPIGARLAANNNPNIKGVIFVATFLSSPNKIALLLAKSIPLQALAKIPISSFFIRLLLLGSDASNELVQLFLNTVAGISKTLLNKRIDTLRKLTDNQLTSTLPICYIQASKDRLVKANKLDEFREKYQNLEVHQIKGPHFILQSKPSLCAEIISNFAQKSEIF